MSNNIFDIEKFKDQIPYYLTAHQKEGLINALRDFLKTLTTTLAIIMMI